MSDQNNNDQRNDQRNDQYRSSDHDLLIRISEQVSQMRLSLEADRSNWNSRIAAQDVKIDLVEKDVESLRVSRATIYGMTVALSAIISVLLKVFWK